MTQHNLTQILKVIRDLVMRNRPCYRDYLGTDTVTTTIQICHGNENSLQLDNASFTGFVVGETFQVTINGETADYVARLYEGYSIIGTYQVNSAEEENGWLIYMDDGDAIIYVVDGIPADSTISVSQTKTETVKRYNTRLLPEYLLPAFLRKNVVASKAEVQSAAAKATAAADAAADAQITANAAQTTANAAQTTANAAQTTANAALPKSGGTVSGNLTVDAENDSYRAVVSAGEMALQYVNSAGTANDMVVISGRLFPSLVGNAGSDSGFRLSGDGLSLGNTSTSKDGIHLTHSNRSSTPGKIVIQHTNLGNSAKERISIESTGAIICNNHLKFDCGSEIEVVQTLGETGGSAIILRSSTADSTKRFRITVDDIGTLTATEVTS